MRGTGWEHEGTCWKGAPHSPCLLKIARLSTDRGHRTSGWQGRQGHCRQLDRRVSDYRARAGEEGRVREEQRGAHGQEGRLRRRPAPGSLARTRVQSHVHSHTHPRIHTFKNTFTHVLSPIHNAPMNTRTH